MRIELLARHSLRSRLPPGMRIEIKRADDRQACMQTGSSNRLRRACKWKQQIHAVQADRSSRSTQIEAAEFTETEAAKQIGADRAADSCGSSGQIHTTDPPRHVSLDVHTNVHRSIDGSRTELRFFLTEDRQISNGC
jgi:hypothetical protein